MSNRSMALLRRYLRRPYPAAAAQLDAQRDIVTLAWWSDVRVGRESTRRGGEIFRGWCGHMLLRMAVRAWTSSGAWARRSEPTRCRGACELCAACGGRDGAAVVCARGDRSSQGRCARGSWSAIARHRGASLSCPRVGCAAARFHDHRPRGVRGVHPGRRTRNHDAIRRAAHGHDVGRQRALLGAHRERCRRWGAAGSAGSAELVCDDVDRRRDPRRWPLGYRVARCAHRRRRSGSLPPGRADTASIPAGQVLAAGARTDALRDGYERLGFTAGEENRVYLETW